MPASKNPVLAKNGPVDCNVSQPGNVRFLAGYLSANADNFTFTRSCTIPGGEMLVIPLINSWADNVCVTPPMSVDQLRASATNVVTPPDNLHASIDGQPLTNLNNRAVSPVFSYTLAPPPDNVLHALFGVSIPPDCGQNNSTITPAVADGFYITVSPLTAGKHKINFGGGKTGGFSLDMTYTLTVGS